MRADNISNVGARCVSLSPLTQGRRADHRLLRHPGRALRARAVLTNTMPTNAYRSSGRPEVMFVIERLIDLAADAARLRPRRAAAQEPRQPKAMPYRNAVGMIYDSGAYEANMDLRACELADWEGFKQRKREAKKRGKLRGLGISPTTSSPRSARRASAPRSRCSRTAASTS